MPRPSPSSAALVSGDLPLLASYQGRAYCPTLVEFSSKVEAYVKIVDPDFLIHIWGNRCPVLQICTFGQKPCFALQVLEHFVL